MTFYANIKFGITLFCKMMPNFCKPHAMSINKFIDNKTKLRFLAPELENYTTHLTLDTYSAEEMVDIECFNCL